MVCLSAYGSAQTKTITGKVVGVADGDTITLLDPGNKQFKIRFQGIDAPESRQAFGQRSKQNLSDLVFGKTVTVEFEKTDRYGRTLGKVLLDGKDINLEQLKAGLAWFYRHYQNELGEADRKAYDAAEAEAKKAKRGLWQDANPQPPWDYRHPSKETGSVPTTTVPSVPDGSVIGNRRSMIYHLPNCPNYNDVSPQNRVPFKSEDEAQKAGYRKARNCP
ncbi:MAG: thermonuclease family protein [Acidobacteria bacterium]|nr:thermonuclease family protein [Acidobacteriota bacterium]